MFCAELLNALLPVQRWRRAWWRCAVETGKVKKTLDRVAPGKILVQFEKIDFIASAATGVTFERLAPVTALPD